MSDRVEDDLLNEDVDMSTVTDLEQQKTYCKKMLKVLELEGQRLRKRFTGTQTINGFVDSSAKLRSEVSEYIGYNYGSINQCMVLVDSAVVNLQQFDEGSFDDVENNARGMFLSLWYNLGLSHISMMNEIMADLEKFEKDLWSRLVEESDENEVIVSRGVLH